MRLSLSNNSRDEQATGPNVFNHQVLASQQRICFDKSQLLVKEFEYA
jgi:hypothetical protein